ncbi:hypothetical protein GI582_05370 [Sulfitobacter sp. BDSS02]|uniref:hypothetical protein n=1 Tax=Rhodobacterales TaxID=204455 RepID=UPI0012FD72D2|nr:hypothetical protein [Pseudooceanicola marinus]MBL3702126.1 hypothetical protein [Sulfitobacter sp. BDSS02]MBR9848475.1 hypothetical protein [Paracoccaceae bacterium]
MTQTAALLVVAALSGAGQLLAGWMLWPWRPRKTDKGVDLNAFVRDAPCHLLDDRG